MNPVEETLNVPYINIEAFQGPMDLLLHLIRQNKVDIYDIPIALIADQFMASLKQMDALDMEITSEFLLLASQLLYLKSRQLLPLPQKTEEEQLEEEMLKQDLVERIVSYRIYKNAAAYLQIQDSKTGSNYFRKIDVKQVWADFPQPNPLQGITLEQLYGAFQRILLAAEKGDSVRYMEVEEIPVEMMIRDILRRLILHPKGLLFEKLLFYPSRLGVVVAFLALLELLKNGQVKVEQGLTKEEIFIIPTPKAAYFIDEGLT